MTSTARLKIGTRGSPLALAQAVMVQDALAAAHPEFAADGAIEIRIIKTSGDVILDRPLAEIGGKGLFTKEIELALLDGTIDLAVHSMKDMPTILPDGLMIAAMLPRADVRDVLIGPWSDLDTLPEGAVVGTTSLRRQAQVLARRPDLRIVSFRGNVQTRLRKLAAGEADVTLLAKAGLDRLRLEDVPAHPIPTEVMLPAVAQGAIGVEARVADEQVLTLLATIDAPLTHACVRAERAMLAVLDGSCRTPIAGLAERDADGTFRLAGLVAAPDGGTVHRIVEAGHDPLALGRSVGRHLLDLAS